VRGRACLFNDPLHWANRAEEARALAEEMVDPNGRANMLVIYWPIAQSNG
jgi:hypothetical protein